MMVVDILKCESQYPKSIYALAIPMNLLRYALSLMIILRCLQDNLSGPGVDELLYFSTVLMNSSFENKFQFMTSLQGIFLSSWESVWQSWAELNDK